MTEKISIRRDPRKPKPWICRWYGLPDPETGKSKRYSKAFDTYREAEQFKAKRLIEFEKGVPRDRAEDVPLHQFCREWLSVHRADLRPASIKLYDDAIDRLCDHFGKQTMIRSITNRKAARFIGSQTRKNSEEVLSNWTRHRIARNARTMFASAVEWNLIPANPFKGVGPKKKTLKVRDWHELTPQQFQKLLAGVNLRRKAMYVLFYCLGLRLGEALALMWHNIDFGAATVKIKDRPGSETEPPFHVKDHEGREIPIPQFALRILEDLRAYNEVTDQSPYVCLSEGQYETLKAKWQRYRSEGRAWRNDCFQNNTLTTFKRDVKRAGIEPDGILTIHVLRKNCILNWARVNRNPKVTQELAGHADLATTMTFYSKVGTDAKRQTARDIDALLSNKTDAELTPDA